MTYTALRAAIEASDESDYTLGQFKADLSTLIRERDALREALVSCVDHGSMTGDEWVIDKARSALALEKQQ